MKIYNFTVIITQGDDGIYVGKVPALHGCHTQAKSLLVLYKRIEEAIELCLEVEKEKNIPCRTKNSSVFNRLRCVFKVRSSST